ncbi:hypothetical protein V2G26_002362 [Clonostachys chloroleuca]
MFAKLEEKCHFETFVEFVLVDIDGQPVRPAFHHRDLARQLEKHAGSSLGSDKLPFTWIEIEDGLVHFRFQKQIWEYNIEEMYSAHRRANSHRGILHWLTGVRRAATSLDEGKSFISQGQTLLQRSNIGVVWKFVGSRSRAKGTCDSDLPKGWEERIIETGLVYYPDHNTKSTSWRLPFRSFPTISPNQMGSSPRFETEGSDSPQSQFNQLAEVEKSGDDETTVFIHQYNVWMRSSREERGLSSGGNSESPYVSKTILISPNKQSAIVWQCMAAEDMSMSYNIDYTPDNQFLPKLIQISTQLPADSIRAGRPRLFSVSTQSEISTTDDLFSNPFPSMTWAGFSGETSTAFCLSSAASSVGEDSGLTSGGREAAVGGWWPGYGR